ncbi:PREDICTED: E3 ubiquitin-protein ligase MBR2-like isoform X2 [Camelina sativa]|uniref:RING-type E3 ubiquitin transferase n=1 Tax=Camelina sativa TaxID=90675 RepID=A0ABM0TXG8_CAMSA|nr:PREDICTED: E3 ubiquitin-protein ligase MBR2-like isoform X2 [Camelina sativa]
MDRWSSKRAIEVRPDSKKGVGVVFRDRLISNSCKVPFSSDEKKSMNFTRFVGCSDKKQKSILSTYRSSPIGKEATGTSSKVCGSSSSSLKTEKQPLSQVSMDSSESSRGSDNEEEPDILDVSLGRDKRRVNNKLVYGKVITPEAECSNLPSSSRIKRGFRQRFGLSKQESHPGSSGQSTSANRGCSPLLSGVIPTGFGLEKRFSRKVDTINKRKVYGESSSSSSARGKDVTEPPTEVRRHPRGSASGSRRDRHRILNDDNDVALVGSQRNKSNSHVRFLNRGNGRDGLSSIRATEMSQTETSNNLNSPVSLDLFSGFQDSFRSYNLDGISEILPELDRIEQDIELNYEDLLIMETGLLLGGLSFHDQHRDMRLDIDNMSYEELLALEERIGTVSTALTEEAISKCLKTSIYQMKTLSYGSITKSSSDHKEDAKCSICQEEYTIGDEVGRLHCEHTYHVKCVQEWLRMKSWCPICKATAETSSK